MCREIWLEYLWSFIDFDYKIYLGEFCTKTKI